MRAFAIVAADENLAFWHDGVNFAGCGGFGAIFVRYMCAAVGAEAIWVFVVKDSQGAIFYDDMLAGESDDAFDDVLIFDARSRVTCEGFTVAAVGKYDNLAALRDVFLLKKVGHSNRYAVDNDAVVGMKGVFHAGADDVVASKNESIQDESANYHCDDKGDEAERIFYYGMALEKGWLHIHQSILA